MHWCYIYNPSLLKKIIIMCWEYNLYSHAVKKNTETHFCLRELKNDFATQQTQPHGSSALGVSRKRNPFIPQQSVSSSTKHETLSLMPRQMTRPLDRGDKPQYNQRDKVTCNHHRDVWFRRRGIIHWWLWSWYFDVSS